ncbi:MAG: hypothetical protein O2887_10435 [Bacteroidetes bacterium]|nr:hypothetical protein [Bacteroidota bacterium]
MLFTNPKQTEAARTIEKRIIEAVTNNQDIIILIAEVESLYKLQYLNDKDYNFLTDISFIKELYS